MNLVLPEFLARRFTNPTARRTIVGLLMRTTIGGTLAVAVADAGDGKRRKKKKCKCKRKKPDGTPCGDGQVCLDQKYIPVLTDGSCSASDDFCAQQWARCQGTVNCGCFVTIDVPSQAICANLENFEGCPVTSGCESSDDCPDVEFCVSMPCCPEGKSVCIPLCVPPEQ